MRYIAFVILACGLCLAQEPTAEQDMARAQQECPQCARVLISHLDTVDKRMHDGEKTGAQAAWLAQNAKLEKAGKIAPRIWFTDFRSNAEYTLVWTIQLDKSQRPTKMDAWAWVYDAASGKKLFQTWRRTVYLKTEHPDEQCFIDAVNFLRSRQVTPDGAVFTAPSSSGNYYPAPGEEENR